MARSSVSVEITTGNVDRTSPPSRRTRSGRAGPTEGAAAKKSITRLKTYGAIEGIQVGATFANRILCSKAGVHTPIRPGICGGPDGAYSVVLSGGYKDDKDEGETFIYTGAGGRDAKTEKQVKDQKLDQGYNKSLYISKDSGKPVRVVRGAKSESKYAPLSGYRYDGLYIVDDVKKVTGKDGHTVCKAFFVRMSGQPPIPLRPEANH